MNHGNNLPYAKSISIQKDIAMLADYFTVFPIDWTYS